MYVAPVPGPGGKFQVSNASGLAARWRRDGKELFYMAADRRMMVAEVKEEGAALIVGAVRPMFQSRSKGIFYGYDSTADGQRLLINSMDQEDSQPLTLVVNWPATLKH